MQSSARKASKKPTIRFEAVKIDKLFDVLDAVAWLDSPSAKQIADFANIDPRTAGKILKNARLMGLVQSPDGTSYILSQAYPYKGTAAEKKGVVREAMLRLPLIRSMRQFIALGDVINTAMRKAAILAGESDYDQASVAPLVSWAISVTKVFDLDVRVETLVDEAVATKQIRHLEERDKRVAFISHSTKDKPFVRKLAADLVKAGTHVWLDEQQILVGDSVPEKIAQGLAESDFFLIVVSRDSVESPWVRMELSNALVNEIERRKVSILPIKLDDAAMPLSIKDKSYADFRGSYEDGLKKILNSLKSRSVTNNGTS